MFYGKEHFNVISEEVEFVDLSPSLKLGDFNCGVDDYNEFLLCDAPKYIEDKLCQVTVLLNKENDDIIGYMALCTDSFLLDKEEKLKEGLDIPFNSVPALKIGKLAVSANYRHKPYGSFLLWVAKGYAEELNETGVGCRFLVVDADIAYDPNTPMFYEINGFVLNEKENKNRNRSLSMRYDTFED